MVGGRRTFWNGTFVLQVDGMAQGCNLHGFIDDSPFFYLALEGGILPLIWRIVIDKLLGQ